MANLKESIFKTLSEKEAKHGLHVNTISERIFMSGEYPDITLEELTSKIIGILSRDVKGKNPEFSKVRNGKGGFKKGIYKIKTKISITPNPKDPDSIMKINPEMDDTDKEKLMAKNLFIGKAGECSVMSELLFRGYNANSMMVDDGVDIVANKDNIYYFIQVKTTYLKDGKIYAAIKQNRFDAFIGNQIRYVVVARCKISNIDSNIFFVFNNSDIQKFIFNNTVNATGNDIRIKIRMDSDTKKPILYHTREEDISFYMNRFDPL